MSDTLLLYDAHEIIPRLWLGSITPTHYVDFFRSHGITHVVTVLESHNHGITQLVPPSEHTDQYTPPAMIEAGVKQFHAPVYDCPTAPLHHYFTDACRFIHDALSSSPANVVYVHCFAGISRSSTIVAAYLILRNGAATPNTVIEAIRARRPQVNPNPGFREQLIWWHSYARAQLKETAPTE